MQARMLLLPVALVALCLVLGGQGSAPPAPAAPPGDKPGPADAKDSFRYYGPNGLWKTWTEGQRNGRDTWIFWTGGNQKFLRLTTLLGGRSPLPISVEFYRMLDSRERDQRFARFGMINEPNCTGNYQEPETLLWLDKWEGDGHKRGGDKVADAHFAKGDYPYYPDPKAYAVEYGEPTGVVGLRKFRNPKFWDDPTAPKRWRERDMAEYFARPWSVEPPYFIGFSCAFCHIAFDPTRPPADPAKPRWENLAANIGNQYFREGDLFLGRGRALFGDRNPRQTPLKDPYATDGLGPNSLLFHYAVTQQPGTSETSRISYDFINNPNTMNSIFYLGNRPLFPEQTPDGRLRIVNHVLKDGADSVGIQMALLRVWINIGCEGRFWVDSLYNPGSGRRQKPLNLDDLRLNARDDRELTKKEKERRAALRQQFGADVGHDWAEAHRRNPDLLSYLASYTPYHLADAPGGKDNLLDESKPDQKARLENGKRLFARHCAACHSNKQPIYSLARTQRQRAVFYEKSVLAADFRAGNTLSDDVRYSVNRPGLGTNMARALATNAIDGDIWAELSSKTYKGLPPVGRVRLAYKVEGGKLVAKPAADKPDPAADVGVDFTPPGGGRGYYRTPSLVSMWATAPYLHNNALGDYYTIGADKLPGWVSSDGGRWRKDKNAPWQPRKTLEIDYRIDTSVKGRLLMFEDGVEKMLWPEKRDRWIKRTLTDCQIVDLKPVVAHLLPGVLAGLLVEAAEQEAARSIDAYLKEKKLPPAVAAVLREKTMAAVREQLALLRARLAQADLATLKEQLLGLAKTKLLEVVAGVAGPAHAEALKAKLADLHQRLAAAAARLLSPDVLKVPAGTPINLYFNLGANALPYALAAQIKYHDRPRELAQALLALSDCPDLVEDKGHTFGAREMTDAEKRDLIEFLKTL